MTRAVSVYIRTADPPEIQRPDSPDLGHIVDTLDTLDSGHIGHIGHCVVLQIVHCGQVSVASICIGHPATLNNEMQHADQFGGTLR